MDPSTQRTFRFISYAVVAIIFFCLFAAPMLTFIGKGYQQQVVMFGLLVLGLSILIGMPLIWCNKAPLHGHGLHITFQSNPVAYVFLLIFGTAIGLAIAFLGATQLLGVHFAPGF